MKHVLLLLLCIFFLVCCKKDPEINPAKKLSPPETIIAGIAKGNSDHPLLVHDIYPDTILFRSNRTTSYSIDLNEDGIADIRLTNANKTSTNPQGIGTSDTNGIETLNPDTYILCDSVYKRTVVENIIYLVVDVDSLYPKVVKLHDTICSNAKFRQGSFILFEYGIKQSQTNFEGDERSTYTGGAWQWTDQKYVAVRHKDQLGWIMIGFAQNGIRVYEYACIKN